LATSVARKGMDQAGKYAKKKAKKAGKFLASKLFLYLFSTTGILVVAGIILVVILGSLLASISREDPTEFEGGGVYEVDLSQLGADSIPAEFVDTYMAAADKYGVPWTLLAAIHRVETVFSTNNTESYAGAVGHMQFMPLTWIGWSYPGGNAAGDANIPEDILTDPEQIKKYGGYGVDANGDGKADPNDLEDAVHTTAKYLRDNGGISGDFRGAVYQYNHADWYVDEVFGFFEAYTSGYTLISVLESGNVAKGGNKVIESAISTGSELIGKSPYNWGGGRTPADILARSFDCSSFVRWAYSVAGIDLGPVATTTTDTLVRQGKAVSANEMKRGDLIFFDTYKVNGHVGIYLGNGQFLNDNSSKGVAIDSLDNVYWKNAFKGVARRVVE
jgi:peptidoglycan DL-endopeptidase CwlO